MPDTWLWIRSGLVDDVMTDESRSKAPQPECSCSTQGPFVGVLVFLQRTDRLFYLRAPVAHSKLERWTWTLFKHTQTSFCHYCWRTLQHTQTFLDRNASAAVNHRRWILLLQTREKISCHWCSFSTPNQNFITHQVNWTLLKHNSKFLSLIWSSFPASFQAGSISGVLGCNGSALREVVIRLKSSVLVGRPAFRVIQKFKWNLVSTIQD